MSSSNRSSGGRLAPAWILVVASALLATADARGQGHFGGNSWLTAPGGSGYSAGSSWINGPSGGSFASGGGVFLGGGGAGATGSNTINYNPSIFVGYGPNGTFAYANPLIVIGQGGTLPVAPPLVAPVPVNPGLVAGGGGLRLPMPPRQPVVTRTSTARRPNPARAIEHVEIGDRSFRVDNTKRAEDRYKLAVKTDPGSALPRVRLAQVALVRGKYAEAARYLRDAVAAEPGYLLNAPDIQALFVEPSDFAKELATLEAHLQAEPGDRDGWFLLGAEWYLSGRTQKASDAFQRLTDRRPDLALAAFLDATSPRRAAPDVN